MFRTVVEWLELYGDAGRGRVRIVADSRSPRGRAPTAGAYLRYEAASNVVFDRFDTTVLCPYDAERVPGTRSSRCVRTDPEVLDHGHTRRSELFMDPRALVGQRVRDTAVQPGVTPYALQLVEDIPAARALVRSTTKPRTRSAKPGPLRTLLGGWAYGALYRTSAERAASLDGWLDYYNHRRRHSALGHKPPIARLNERTNLLGTYI